ncbi:hypothetical protein MLD38_014843 [Melastoma candidum]|uniref:Uncharacterized protein n=1 Tax=Melastoma candidum TaxID=119954 RepID=A0ACB9RH74_9MYRT|nr:hypothetical protein MLD38_014843 [Melastoma candidum]
MLFLLAMSMLMKDHIVFRTSNTMCEVAIAILSPISRHPSILLWEMVVTRKAWREGSRIRNQNILHFEKPAMDTLPWRL